MICRLRSAAVVGVDAIPVDVEVDRSQGLPGFRLVGLPDGAVREGSVRIRSALINSGFQLPTGKVTVNLAPAALRKDGAAFDLPIALATLHATGAYDLRQPDLVILGELALDGRVRPIRGCLAIAESAQRCGSRGLVVPVENTEEAALVEGLDVFGVETLRQAIDLLKAAELPLPAAPTMLSVSARSDEDFAELCGQPMARRAAEIAAAGGHNLMLVGPPGAGKTMVARRLAGLLPPLSRSQAVETLKIQSAAGQAPIGNVTARRPFRAPHHTTSPAGLVGGGTKPRPGEVSLAHHGILFLDELPEFQRGSLEVLRQPLEAGVVSIARAAHSVTFPASFMLVAAMNPCPCGFRGSTVRCCTCGEREAARYVGRISGPLLDRFDLCVYVSQPRPDEVISARGGEGSSSIASRVKQARACQRRRFRRCRCQVNADMDARQLWRYVRLSEASRKLVQAYAREHHLSARAVHRVCRVARTIADLADRDDIDDGDLALAFSVQSARWRLCTQ